MHRCRAGVGPPAHRPPKIYMNHAVFINNISFIFHIPGPIRYQIIRAPIWSFFSPAQLLSPLTRRPPLPA